MDHAKIRCLGAVPFPPAVLIFRTCSQINQPSGEYRLKASGEASMADSKSQPS